MIPLPQTAAEPCLNRALRGGRIVAWEWDLDAGLRSWSDNVREILGGTFASQSAFEQHVHPHDKVRHHEALERTLTQGQPYHVEMRFIRPNGSVIWIEN